MCPCTHRPPNPRASSVSSSGGLWRWSCQGDYASPTSCTAVDYVCAPNQSQSCSITGGTGKQYCAGDGMSFGTCTLDTCQGGYYASGNSCLPQVCTPGSKASCSVPNGSGETFVPSELVSQRLGPLPAPRKRHHVYCSAHNPGALALMEDSLLGCVWSARADDAYVMPSGS